MTIIKIKDFCRGRGGGGGLVEGMKWRQGMDTGQREVWAGNSEQ